MRHASALVLREDVGRARRLRGWSCLAMRLFQLLQCPLVHAPALLQAGLVVGGSIFVETVAHALPQRIDPGVAACLRFLVAHSLVVIFGVKRAGSGRQLYHLAVGRHLAVRSVRRSFANVGATCC